MHVNVYGAVIHIHMHVHRSSHINMYASPGLHICVSVLHINMYGAVTHIHMHVHPLLHLNMYFELAFDRDAHVEMPPLYEGVTLSIVPLTVYACRRQVVD